MRYAIVDDDVVVNLILWDGEEPYEAEEDHILYEVSDEISIGWMLVDNQWVAPERPIPEPLPEDVAVDEARLAALNELTSLGVTEATARTIVGLPPLTPQE